MTPTPERIPLPTPAPAPARRGIPLVAAAAPLAIALVLWITTSSPTALLIGLFGPVIVVAGALDARRAARRSRRREIATVRERMTQLVPELQRRLAERAAELAATAPSLVELVGAPLPGTVGVWRLGTGDLPSGIVLVAPDEAPELVDDVERLRSLAATIADAPVVMRDVAVFAVDGPDAARRSLARSLVLQAVARCAPGTARVTVPSDEEWAELLPCAVETAALESGMPWAVTVEGRVVLEVGPIRSGPEAVAVELSGRGDEPRIDGVAASRLRLALVSRAEAGALARGIAEASRAAGWRPGPSLPGRVELAELLEAHPDGSAMAAPLACDAAGVVEVDLEEHGPHALVAGTTGAGKSELLISWVVALAARHPPAALAFLLVDFKGGAAFAPLTVLPHVIGVVSDLDTGTASRAVRSLRAELNRRERELARHGAREVRELPGGVLARLVIVVDEFAALVAADAELQQVFADIAARGRSLGLHLLLGTQRPTGVVRDAVLANISVRLCLRVLDAGESVAMTGGPDAAAIPVESRGRAVLRDAGAGRPVQIARTDAALVARVAQRWADAPVPEHRPWLDALPAALRAADLAGVRGAGDGSAIVGLVDVPERQRREPLRLDPWHAGAALVLGASGTGRTTALAALADAVDAELRWADEPAELWQALTLAPIGERALVLVDDLDRVLALGDAEQRAELAELVVQTARDTRRSGIAVAASARGPAGVHPALAAFEQRLLLRLASREEHLLAGGETRDHRPDRRPGSASWHGHEAQLVLASTPPRAWRAEIGAPRLDEGRWAIAASRPGEWIRRLRAAGVRAAPLGEGEADVVVADVDAWLGEHQTLARVRREGRLLVEGGLRADHRALTRSRAPLPPLRGHEEAWLVEGGVTARVRLVTPAPRHTESRATTEDIDGEPPRTTLIP